MQSCYSYLQKEAEIRSSHVLSLGVYSRKPVMGHCRTAHVFPSDACRPWGWDLISGSRSAPAVWGQLNLFSGLLMNANNAAACPWVILYISFHCPRNKSELCYFLAEVLLGGRIRAACIWNSQIEYNTAPIGQLVSGCKALNSFNFHWLQGKAIHHLSACGKRLLCCFERQCWKLLFVRELNFWCSLHGFHHISYCWLITAGQCYFFPDRTDLHCFCAVNWWESL